VSAIHLLAFPGLAYPVSEVVKDEALVIAPVAGVLKAGRRTVTVDRTLPTARSIEFDALVVGGGTTPTGDIKLVVLLQEAFRPPGDRRMERRRRRPQVCSKVLRAGLIAHSESKPALSSSSKTCRTVFFVMPH
jgi:hypothetical protein